MSLNFSCVPEGLLKKAKESPDIAWEVIKLATEVREKAGKVTSFGVQQGDHVSGLSYQSNPFDIDVNKAA